MSDTYEISGSHDEALNHRYLHHIYLVQSSECRNESQSWSIVYDINHIISINEKLNYQVSCKLLTGMQPFSEHCIPAIDCHHLAPRTHWTFVQRIFSRWHTCLSWDFGPICCCQQFVKTKNLVSSVQVEFLEWDRHLCLVYCDHDEFVERLGASSQKPISSSKQSAFRSALIYRLLFVVYCLSPENNSCLADIVFCSPRNRLVARWMNAKSASQINLSKTKTTRWQEKRREEEIISNVVFTQRVIVAQQQLVLLNNANRQTTL